MLELDAALARASLLTSAQIESVVLQLKVMKGEISGRQAAGLRGGVSVGAYYRVLNQARRNILGSLFTLIVSMRLGVINLKDLNRLLGMVAELPEGIDDENSARVMSLLEALSRKLVMV